MTVRYYIVFKIWNITTIWMQYSSLFGFVRLRDYLNHLDYDISRFILFFALSLLFFHFLFSNYMTYISKKHPFLKLYWPLKYVLTYLQYLIFEYFHWYFNFNPGRIAYHHPSYHLFCELYRRIGIAQHGGLKEWEIFAENWLTFEGYSISRFTGFHSLYTYIWRKIIL
jgi:hypothetical protein